MKYVSKKSITFSKIGLHNIIFIPYLNLFIGLLGQLILGFNIPRGESVSGLGSTALIPLQLLMSQMPASIFTMDQPCFYAPVSS